MWPEPSHSKGGVNGLKPWEPIYKYLDLHNYGKSIFGRKKPLAGNTMNRIARGLKKFVFDNPEPFMVQVNHGGDTFRGQSLTDPLPTITQKHGFGIVTPVVAPFIEKSYGGNYKGSGSSVTDPLHTVTTVDHNHLVMAFLTKFYKSGCGQSLFEPIHTITTSPGHFGTVYVLATDWKKLKESGINEETAQKCTWVSQYIMEYYGSGTGQSLLDPLHTVVTKDRFALITVLGNEYVLLDICLRMLTPEELKLGQGFPRDYIIDRDYRWRKYPVSKQVARIGNSVVPIMAEKLVFSNCPYLKVGERLPAMSVVSEDNGQLKFA